MAAGVKYVKAAKANAIRGAEWRPRRLRAMDTPPLDPVKMLAFWDEWERAVGCYVPALALRTSDARPPRLASQRLVEVLNVSAGGASFDQCVLA